jgi:hypothetical protein
MKNLSILIYENDETEPTTKVRIPLTLMKIANKLVPERINKELQKEDIDLKQILSAIDELEDIGTILEVENKDEKIIIAID